MQDLMIKNPDEAIAMLNQFVQTTEETAKIAKDFVKDTDELKDYVGSKMAGIRDLVDEMSNLAQQIADNAAIVKKTGTQFIQTADEAFNVK